MKLVADVTFTDGTVVKYAVEGVETHGSFVRLVGENDMVLIFPAHSITKLLVGKPAPVVVPEVVTPASGPVA
jgi:hypothetical protein